MPRSRRNPPTAQTAPAPRLGGLLLIAGLALAGLLTLRPSEPGLHQPFFCLACGPLGLLEFLLNAGLFIPIGLALALLGVPVLVGAAALCLLSGAIELLQATVLTGRQPAFGDLAANVLGGVVGLTALRWGALILRPRPLELAVILAAALAAPVATVALLRPAAAPTPQWWGQHAHIIGNSYPLSGEVREVRLNGALVADGILADQSHPRKVLESDTVRFDALVTNLVQSPGPAQIAAIADGAGDWVAWLWVDGPDLIGGLRLRARDARLRIPEVSVRQAAVHPSAATLQVGITGTRGRLEARAGDSASPRTAIRLTTTRTWMLLWPRRLILSADPRLCTTIWLAAWFGMLGLVLGGPARGLFGAAAGLSVIVWTLAAIPLVSGTPLAAWWEWLSACTGLAAGVTARWRIPSVTRGDKPLPVRP